MGNDIEGYLPIFIFSRAAMGVKNLWATKVLGPKKAMHFWKVHYLPLITWGAVYSAPYLVEDNLRNKAMLSFSGPLHFHRKGYPI